MTDDQGSVENAELAAKVDRLAYLVIALLLIEVVQFVKYAEELVVVGLLLGIGGFAWLFLKALAHSTSA
ncbi:hypothetical protein [Halorussus halophilus]|uniref:hypothetical protein n=1 Tax=Halorussus halophilus TaxID=2650975 RepID=UPI0013015920|nr:hypothetical protein [Halorussus halophilus]